MSDKRRRRSAGEGRRPVHRDLEFELLQWIVVQCANNIIVNYYRLQEYTFELVKRFGIEMNSFRCSEKWIFNFMKRNKLTVRKITRVGQADNKTLGEKVQITSDYLDSIPILTADKDAAQVYNMDETPVYADMLSSASIDFVSNRNVGAGHCDTTKACFTAVPCVNAAGKVLKTMINLTRLKNVPKIKPLDVLIIGPFKKALRAEWENWFSNGKKKYTNKAIVKFVTQGDATLNKETIKCAFECCGIAPRGQTVEHCLLNSCLHDVFSGLEVNAPDAHNDKIEDERQVNEISSDMNYGQATNEEI
ncbi:pogo transposable element with KRAB domain [Octopus vulgaris]|uniref:Pogo transposable element with KRAB domain n=1 Tax=Octopus vulgaris TaxID=6645 RepID=A0AA36AJ51_OCTVU|nr:pogo transposable element with KRAB domain [Octopus vulgaris]